MARARNPQRRGDRAPDRNHPIKVLIPGQVAAICLGFSSGASINLLSADLGYRWVSVVGGIGAVLTAANWVRGLPAEAPLARNAPPVLLTVALLAAVLTVFLPRHAAFVVTLLAAGLVAGAVAIPSNPLVAWRLLVSAAHVGIGVAGSGLASAALGDGDTLLGIAFISAAVAAIGRGVAYLRANHTLAGIAIVGLGMAGICGGVAYLHHGDTLLGIAFISAAVAAIGRGVAYLRANDTLAGIALVGGGVAFISVGTAYLRHGGALIGIALVAGSVAFIGAGFSVLRASGVVATLWSRLVNEPGSSSRSRKRALRRDHR